MIEPPIPTPIVTGVKLTEKDVLRFFSLIDKDGPVQPHCPELGPCWIWKAAICKNTGYGNFKARRKSHRAHRVSYALRHDLIPDGLLVCHKCDNPPCANPDHLFLGTQKDNSSDMVSKNRQVQGDRHWSRSQPELLTRGDHHWTRKSPDKMRFGDAHHSRKTPEVMPRGEGHYAAKLDEDKVRAIRLLHAQGEVTFVEIGRIYGVTDVLVGMIVKLRSWKHVI